MNKMDDKTLEINGRKRVIVCAACKRLDGVILAGARHYDPIMISQAEQLPVIKGLSEQGFIDNFQNFVDRETALYIATQNGQHIDFERNGSRTELFSEGLY